MATARMTTRCRQDAPATFGCSRYWAGRTLVTVAALGFMLAPVPALATPPCSATAASQFAACKNQVSVDFFTAQALCLNVLDKEERKACIAEAKAARVDGGRRCPERRRARQDFCDVIGEGPYDPHFGPALFDDPKNPTHPNPYFPLTVGNRWEYVEGSEDVTIKVLDKTKLIEGVTCIVVNDVVAEDGKPTEDTDDWFGQRKDGTVDYCGEISESLETFAGDNPEEGELVSIEGSWKAGRNALAGTIFPGSPTVGMIYRQEFSPDVAEDIGEILSTNYGFGSNAELDQLVPQALAQLLCSAHDCVVTRDTSTLSSGVERKYYARGIGVFLETKPLSGKVGAQLVNCNFDPRCASLPQP